MFEDYFRQYALLIIFAAAAVSVPVGMMMMSFMAQSIGVRPSRPSAVKERAYEWAVKYGVLSRQFGFAALGAVLVFLVVVTIAYAYAWRKHALDWVYNE